MNITMRTVTLPCMAMSLMAAQFAPGPAGAQTQQQMEYERQQREYWRQQEQQRQEQQRLQQLMNDNARRQQEESRRINAPTSPAPGYPGGAQPSGSRSVGAPAAGGAQGDALEEARRTWLKRPPLPADRNPLLGKWTRPASTRGNSQDPFAQLGAMMKGGLCEVLFASGGIFEFRADRLVGSDRRTGEQELDRVEYRGGARRVVVVPKASLKLIVFDFDGPDRINWSGQNCVLVRVGGASTHAAAPAASPASAATTTSAPAASAPAASLASASPAATAPAGAGGSQGGVLALSVGPPAADSSSIVGRKLWVLREDAQVALIKGGLKSTPDGSVLQNWMRACAARAPECAQGARALQAFSVGVATTDADGRASTPSLPAGRYWVLSDAKLENRRVMWNAPVDLRGNGNSLTLDQRNALPLD